MIIINHISSSLLKFERCINIISRPLSTKMATLNLIQTWFEMSKKFPAAQQPETAVNEELNKRVSLFKGDITKLQIDSIVNAANDRLAGGGGVDGAINRAAGPDLQKECNTISGGCPTGTAVLTRGYKLPAKHVIHTVGPQNKSPQLLESCYLKSLELAVKNNIKSIAFPCISTGVYGYPNRDAAQVAIKTTRTFLENNSSLERVIFCVFLEQDEKAYQELLPIYFPSSKL